MANYWIPVEDGLPEYCGKYMCTVKNNYGNLWTKYLFRDALNKRWEDGVMHTPLANNLTVIAWMANPLPYNADIQAYNDRLYRLVYDIRDLMQDVLEAENVFTNKSVEDISYFYRDNLRKVFEKLYQNLPLLAPNGVANDCGKFDWKDGFYYDLDVVLHESTYGNNKQRRIELMRDCLSDVDSMLSEYNYDTDEEDNYTKVLERIRMRINEAENE